jgi:hypothetical protein
LDTDRKEEILSYAENNVLPDNCYYDYHEFRDNCSTRIRDIIDMGTGGQFQAQFSNTPGRFSIRQHVRRVTWSKPLSDWYLDFLMGRDLDRPVSAWDEMFLPVEIGRNIAGFRYTDDSGNERSLVRSVEILNSTKNWPPILNKPLTTWPFHLVFGLILAAFLLFIKKMRVKFPLAGRIAWGTSQSLMGLFFGAAGSVLFFGLFLMPYDYIQQNMNILFINPLLFAAFPLGIFAAAGKPRCLKSEKSLRILWTCVFVAGIIAILVGLLPGLHQQNKSALALILPAALVLMRGPSKTVI